MKSQIQLFGFTVIAIAITFSTTNQADAQRNRGSSTSVWKFLSEKYDKNKDGKLTKEEYDRSDEKFNGFDLNKDGVLTAEDWTAKGNSRGGRSRGGDSSAAPAKGDVAPEFSLTTVADESKIVKLSSFAGKKPVALVFGSCT
jgi:hypothetical protein